jgi:hypothetical protein
MRCPASIFFDFGNAVDAEIRIAFEDDGVWSYMGTDAKGIHVRVLHEFGHAIGLGHEVV